MAGFKLKGGAYQNVDEAGLDLISPLIINMYSDEFDNAVSIPGKELWKTVGSGEIKGAYFWRSANKTVMVSGSTVYLVSMDDFTITTCSGVALSGKYRPTFADGIWAGTPKLWLADGGRMINITAAGAMSFVADADAPTQVSHVGTIDQYVFCNKLGTAEIHHTESPTLPDSWRPIDHFIAEYRPDSCLATLTFMNEIYVFGGQSTETWYDDGVTPFSRLNAGTNDLGIASQSAYCIASGGLYFLDNKRVLRLMQGRNPVPLSQPFQKVLNQLSFVQDMGMFPVTVDGRSWIILTFPTDELTIAYDYINNKWATWGEFSTLFPANSRYGGMTFKRDKINCSVEILPVLGAESSLSEAIAGNVVDDAGIGTISWLTLSTDTWNTLSTSGYTKRTNQMSAELNGKVYCIGGYDGSARSAINQAYDPSGSAWSTKSSVPIIIDMAGITSYLGVIVLAGGLTGSGSSSSLLNSVYIYDLADAWTVGPTLPFWVYGNTLVATPREGYVYSIGGMVNYSSSNVSGSSVSGVLVAYDYANGILITALPPMPTARYNFAATYHYGKIYCIGGNTGSTKTGVMEVYDIASGSWSSLSGLTTPRSGHSARAVDGFIYVFGGTDVLGNALSSVEIYDVKNSVWSVGTIMPLGKANFCVGGAVPVVSGKLYLAGGGNPTTPQANLVEYTP